MRRFLLLLLSLTLAIAPACAAEAISFTDSLGETVELSKRPENVAVLFSSFAEMWTLAGGEVAVTVGETIERGFAPAEADLVDDGAGKSVNLELLISLKPDFVICSADLEAQAEACGILRQAGIPAARFRVEDFSDYLDVFGQMCAITGNDAAYEQYGASVADEIGALLSSPEATAAEGTRILFVRAGSTASSTKAKTSADHFACAMLTELGCENIADASSQLSESLNMEYILTEDPDAVFFSLMGDADAALANVSDLLSQPAWQQLRAVREGNVHILPKELFHFKPNARWAEAYAYLIDALNGAHSDAA